MYCPKCSQQQPSDEMRFCSRCGFPLATVATLVNNNGTIPQLASEPKQLRRSSRSRMITESVILTAFCWGVVLLATFWFNAHGVFEVVAQIAALIFFGIGLIGLIRFLYAFLSVRDYEPTPKFAASQTAPEVATSRETVRPALSAHESIPLTDWPRRPNTREMVRAPSVTENTTRLLEEDTNQ
jgi:hypothetical protein